MNYLLTLCLVIVFTSLSVTTVADSKPNFIFFFPDTLRAESFNSYGNTVPNVTPNFDAFAKTGTRFEQAHVAHTQCSPSRCMSCIPSSLLLVNYLYILPSKLSVYCMYVCKHI